MSIEILKELTYQGVKRLLIKMEEQEVRDLEEKVDYQLYCLYNSLSCFGKDKDLTEKEYHIIMKGVKKLEVIKGFLIDRIEKKAYMEYEKVV